MADRAKKGRREKGEEEWERTGEWKVHTKEWGGCMRKRGRERKGQMENMNGVYVQSMYRQLVVVITINLILQRSP